VTEKCNSVTTCRHPTACSEVEAQRLRSRGLTAVWRGKDMFQKLAQDGTHYTTRSIEYTTVVRTNIDGKCTPNSLWQNTCEKMCVNNIDDDDIKKNTNYNYFILHNYYYIINNNYQIPN